MTKIIKSLIIIGVISVIAIGGTIAYFSDTETSTENTFTAGELDLKINNECHYNGMVCKCDAGVCVWQAENPDSYVETKDAYIGGPCACTWAAKDLDGERFYDYEDIKPGDWGEHTISIHVDDNDAYGRILVTAIENRENNCNDPESDVDNTCIGRWCGELAQNMYTFSWIDDGLDGLPGTGDAGEGDNIWQDNEESLTDPDCGFPAGSPAVGVQGPNGQIYCPVLPSPVAEDVCAVMSIDPQGDLLPPYDAYVTQTSEIGFITGGVTHYIATAWFVPTSVNNIIQGDSIQADISFEIVQARHNDPNDPFSGM